MATVGDFELTGEELRAVAHFVAEAAQEVLHVFEEVHPDGHRPRAAVDAAWDFANGARRSKLLRVASLEAHRAAKGATTEVARLAAQAAGDAASAAYLHPIAKAHQVGHILRAPANAARIAEFAAGDDPDVGRSAIMRAGKRATPTLTNVLRRYPVAPDGSSRTAQLMADLDGFLRRSPD